MTISHNFEQFGKLKTCYVTMHGKPFFLFPDVMKRWSFQKARAGIWSFWYYWERLCFFFPKIWSYTLDGKWKMIFLKKIHGNMIFSLSPLKRWFFKKGPRRGTIFPVLSRNMVLSSENTTFFPWAGGQGWPPSRKTWKCDIFCVQVWVLQTWCHAPLPKKIKDSLIPQKYT